MKFEALRAKLSMSECDSSDERNSFSLLYVKTSQSKNFRISHRNFVIKDFF